VSELFYLIFRYEHIRCYLILRYQGTLLSYPPTFSTSRKVEVQMSIWQKSKLCNSLNSKNNTSCSLAFEAFKQISGTSRNGNPKFSLFIEVHAMPESRLQFNFQPWDEKRLHHFSCAKAQGLPLKGGDRAGIKGYPCLATWKFLFVECRVSMSESRKRSGRKRRGLASTMWRGGRMVRVYVRVVSTLEIQRGQ
jgi:hypothetical protein